MGLKAVATLVSGGGAPVGGSGTPGKLAKFTGATTLGDSLLSESGTTITSAATAQTFSAAQTWTLPSSATALTLGGVLTLNTSQNRLGINAAPGTLLHVSDGLIAAPSYDGIRLGNTAEALFSSTDGISGFRAGVTGGTVVVGSTTSHDLLLQRGNATALTLGASGAVTFAGNLTSSAAQTWTLAASSATALNIASNLLNIDTLNNRVGVGTASPTSALDVVGTISSSGPIRATGTNAAAPAFTGSDPDTGVYFPASNQVRIATSGSLAIAVDASQNVGIGTATPSDRLTISGGGLAITGNITGATTAANSLAMDSSGGSARFFSIGASASLFGNYVFSAAKSGSSPGALQACVIDQAAGVLLGPTTTAVFYAGNTGQGIKLPATPGNADVRTLDAYNENTAWAPSVTWGTGGTVTTLSATGAFTQIGNVVTFTVTIAYNSAVVPTGGAITIDLPRTSAAGFNQRPGTWAFNSFNGTTGTNFLSIGGASTTATLRVATATGTVDIAANLTVTASGALVVTATYLAS